MQRGGGFRGFAGAILVLLAFALAGCGIFESLGARRTGSQSEITGEPLLFRIDPASGAVLDRDVLPGATADSVVPHKGEIIAIVMDTAFVKVLREFGNPHVLIYAQVFDDGSDNPDSAITKVLFNGLNQPPDVHIGVADRVLYGPTAFKGFPIRIKFTIVELDKDQKERGSLILDSFGSVASSVAPQAAPAIGIAVQIGQLINALDEDDFELRYDFTLSPFESDTIATLPPFPKGSEKRVKLMLQKRLDQRISLNTSLRTGKYIILKRELTDREGKPSRSNVSRDFAQLAIIRTEKLAEEENGQTTASIADILVYQGEYLQKLTVRIDKGKKSSVVVVPEEGPNQGIRTRVAVGGRELYRDNTYVAFTVQNGLPHGITPEALRAGSRRDSELIASLLEDPAGLGTSERIGNAVDDAALAVGALVQQRRIASMVGERVGRDKAFRTSPEYPAFWVAQLNDDFDTKGGDRRQWTQETRNAIALNKGILETLNSLVINIPPDLRADDKAKMTKWKGLGKDNFRPATRLSGVFCYIDDPRNPDVPDACKPSP